MVQELSIAGGRGQDEEEGVAHERDSTGERRSLLNGLARILELSGEIGPGHDPRDSGEEDGEDGLKGDFQGWIFAVSLDGGPTVVPQQVQGGVVDVGETGVVTQSQLLRAVHGAVHHRVIKHPGEVKTGKVCRSEPMFGLMNVELKCLEKKNLDRLLR